MGCNDKCGFKWKKIEDWKIGGLAKHLHFQTSNLLKKRVRGFKDSRIQVEKDRRLEGWRVGRLVGWRVRDRKQKTGDRRQETGNRRQKTGEG